MTRDPSRRGLLFLAVVLAALLVVADLLRPESIIRDAVERITPQRRTPLERGLEEFRRTRGGSLRP